MRIEPVSMDDSKRLVAEVTQAFARGMALDIRGGNSKAFLGRPVKGATLDTRSHRGVVSYDPTELVITARWHTACRTQRHAQCGRADAALRAALVRR